MAASKTVTELATLLGGKLEGDGDRSISGLAALKVADQSQLSFLSNRRYYSDLQHTKAAAVLVHENEVVPEQLTCIRVADPYVAFARAQQIFASDGIWSEASVSDLAFIHPTATIADDCYIEAFAWIGENAKIGARAVIEAHVRVGKKSSIGDDCILRAGAVICDGCSIGHRVVLNAGAIVGADGFGFAMTEKENIKIPQIASARLGDDVELGANSCVDRGAIEDTVVQDGVKTDNLTQIGHGAEIGENSIMVAFSGVAGSAKLGANNVMAARSTLLGHAELGDKCQLGVGAIVRKSQPQNSQLCGFPALPHKEWLRVANSQKKLPELQHRIRQLEKQVKMIMGDEETWNVSEILPHGPKAIMLDRIISIESGQAGQACKALGLNDPCFQDHYPNDPILPGVFVLEAMAQLAGIVALGGETTTVGEWKLLSIDKAKFRKAHRPGHLMMIFCQLLHQRNNYFRFQCWTEVDGDKTANAQLLIVI